MDLRALCFFQNGRFLYKIWAWRGDFSVKFGNKGHSINFLIHNISSFDRIDVFWSNMIWAWQQRGFSLKNWKKMIWKHSIFERLDVFQQNTGIRAMCFFTAWTSFWHIIGIGAVFFRKKSEKKSSRWLFSPII